DAKHVDVKEFLRLGDRVLLAGPGKPHAGVVDQHVDPPELRDHRLNRCSDRLVTGDVEIDERQPLATMPSRGIAAGTHYLKSRVNQAAGGELAEARAGASDECDRP